MAESGAHEQAPKPAGENLRHKARKLIGRLGVGRHDQKPTPEDETPRQKMIDVMNKLASTRNEVGVLGIGSYPNDPDKRVEIFIAPVNTIEDKSPEDGGESEIVIATTQGFYAIRFTGSTEGQSAAAQLTHELSLRWSGAIGGIGADKWNITDTFRLERQGKYDALVLKFNLFAPNHEYAERGRLRTTHDGRSVLVSKLVPVGVDSFNRALDASREKARELKMPDTKSALRSVETNAAADSARKRLENL